MAILNETLSRSARVSSSSTNWAGQTTTNGYDLSWVDTRIGTTVPDWDGRIRRLQSASSDYTRTRVAIATFGKFSATIKWKGTPTVNDVASERVVSTLHNGLPTFNAKDLSQVNNIALGNFLVSANEATAPFKGMVFLGELRETLKMLKRPASALRDGFSTYLKRARHAQRRYGRRIGAKVASGLWLEYALGWQPLLGSIKQAAIAYEKYHEAVETFRAFGKASLSLGGDSVTEETFLASNYFHVLKTVNTTHRGSVIYKGVSKNVINGVQEQKAQRVAQLSGFTLSEFIPTAWELIPYSFVVDYFSNIGDILNGMHSLANEWVWYTRSQDLQTTRRAYLTLNTAKIKRLLGQKYADSYESSTPAEWLRSDYVRSSPTLTLPGLVLELPPLGFKWGTLAALIGARINA